MSDGSRRFSVVIPVKNAVGTLGRTLDALRRQTWSDIEVIVVDGGSTDGTLELLAAAELPRLQVLSDAAGGITSAVNLGIRAAEGAFILPWMCADDYLDAAFLASMARTMSAPGVDFAFGNWHVVDRGIVTKSRRPDAEWRTRIANYMPVVLPNSFAFRRSVFERIGYLDEGLRFANDYDLLRRIVDRDLKGSYCEDAWYYYQVGGISQQRYLDCALEVARSAIGHGSSRYAVYAHLALLYMKTNVSFQLNRLRRIRRARASQ